MARLSLMLIGLAACNDGMVTGSGRGIDAAMATDGSHDSSYTDRGALDAAPPIDAESRDAGGMDAGPMDAGPPPDPLDGVGAVELVQGGFMFLEGPKWRVAEEDLLFTDIPRNTIHRLAEPDSITVWRSPSDNANGLAIDPMGRVLAAEHGSRTVTRTLADMSRETVADRFEGDRLNSPNDIVVRSDGTIYFTDPPYGLDGRPREVPFNGVYRVDPGGMLFAEWRGATSSRPNGIGLSPDQRTLYMADTADGSIRAWDVADDGALSGERDFADTAGGPDGMAVDVWGNLWVTSADGVEVFAPDGSRWGAIDFPMRPANCAFGGNDLRTLYVTARTALYRVSVPVTGLP